MFLDLKHRVIVYRNNDLTSIVHSYEDCMYRSSARDLNLCLIYFFIRFKVLENII